MAATRRPAVEVSKEMMDMSKAKRMKLAIDRSRKMAAKEDTTGNITMETPRHSQPPYQDKKISQEVLYPIHFLSLFILSPSTLLTLPSSPARTHMYMYML